MTTIVIDGLNEEDFRRSVQNRLREGRVAPAIARLRALLEPYAGPAGLLPERFLEVTPAELVFSGWESLGAAIARHDRPGRPVTALSIAFGWAGEDVPQPDTDGRLKPFLETAYLNDDSYPFSQSSRDDLLEGYSADGANWSGDHVAADTALALHGIDDLYGALALLEADLLATEDPAEAGLLAGSIAACLLSALLVEAVKIQIANHGVPRPLCVTAGSSGVYPYFDAPIVGMPADVLKAAEDEEDMVPADQGVPVPRYSSLLVTSIPRARKRAVLVLNENAEETALRLSSLRQVQPDEPHVAAPVPQLERFADERLEPEPQPADDSGGLLLAKKPAKTDDLRDKLAPRQDDLQQRLQNLLAPHTPRSVEVEQIPAPSIDWEQELELPVQPAWLRQEAQPAPDLPPDQAIAAEPEFYEEPPRHSAWTRLRNWLGSLRRRGA